MKFFLVLLVGFCGVVVANTQQTTNFPKWNLHELSAIEYANESDKPILVKGFVDTIFEKLKEYANNNINYLEGQLSLIVEKFMSELFFLVDFSLSKVDAYGRDAKAKLIMTRSKNAEVCSKTYGPDVDNVVYKAKNEVENGLVKAIREIGNIQNEVKVHIDAIKHEILKLIDVLTECIKPFNPISTTKCLWKNVKIISSALKDIVSSAYKALKRGSEEISRIVLATKDCITKVSKLAEYHMEVAINATESCLKTNISMDTEHQQDFFYNT